MLLCSLVLPLVCGAARADRSAGASVPGQRPFESDADLQALSQLPLGKLLRVKNSIDGLAGGGADSGDAPAEGGPAALALSSAHADPLRRTDLFSKKKGGKINTLFMLSVTTLAFLAFGGYLLCLIVQAIKGKGNMNIETAGTQQFMVLANSIKKKPQINYGRRRRGVAEDGDEMYLALVALAEGYAAWGQPRGQ